MTGDLFTSRYVNVHTDDYAQALAGQLATHGLATFDGVHDHDTLLTLASGICEPIMHRDADPEGVTTITNTADDNAARPRFRAFTSLALFPHTDGTAQPCPPALLWLVCAQPAPDGGMSVLVDAADVWHTLATRHSDALAALSAPGLLRFGDDPAYSGAVFEPATAGGRRRIRFRNDELVHPAGAAATAWPTLLEAVAAHRHDLHLTAGQGYVLANSHWLHGRTAYTGPRRMLRLLGTPHPRPLPSAVISDGFTTSPTTARATVG